MRTTIFCVLCIALTVLVMGTWKRGQTGPVEPTVVNAATKNVISEESRVLVPFGTYLVRPIVKKSDGSGGSISQRVFLSRGSKEKDQGEAR
jgi:hypothetical protein